ncbi:MAG TPA: hypothetical protein VMS31_21805 [Pyrinomonadaceae bacterium]|nr:hypothetical protein [Pyrinomonadaceae bacterium]
MKILNTILNARNGLRLVLLTVMLCSMATVFLLHAAPAQTVRLTVVNNSSTEIRYLYLSPADNDNWGADQLGDSLIGAGDTRTLDITWDQAAIKLVGEDRDGCFLTATMNATSSIEWTITPTTPLNCGY